MTTLGKPNGTDRKARSQLFPVLSGSEVWSRTAETGTTNGEENQQRGKKAEYEDFGNFNYGATGTAIGFSLAQLLSEGGKLQAVPEGMTEKPKEWGYPAGRFFGSGKYPYGDEPAMQK